MWEDAENDNRKSENKNFELNSANESKIWKAYKKVPYWMKETQRATAQNLKSGDDDDGVYLTTAWYAMKVQSKGY